MAFPKRLKEFIIRWKVFSQHEYWNYRYEQAPDTKSLIYIDPNKIKYYQTECEQVTMKWRESRPPVERHELEKGRFQPEICTGSIVGGPWDKYKIPYNFDRVYRGLRRVFVDGTAWEDTHYGQQLLLQDRTDIEHHDIFHSRIKKNVKIYESMKENGYLKKTSKINEISVNIGREGEFIFNNRGHHRLAISRILDLDSVPVLVVVRHKRWQDIRNYVKEKGSVPEKYDDHPDIRSMLS